MTLDFEDVQAIADAVFARMNAGRMSTELIKARRSPAELLEALDAREREIRQNKKGGIKQKMKTPSLRDGESRA
jgi:hypothetical protein